MQLKTTFLFFIFITFACLAPYSATAATPQVAAGLFHNVALAVDGTVWTWGSNSRGQLCTPNRPDGSSQWDSTPQPVPGLTNVIQVAAGGNFTLALKDDGTIWACGENNYGQLGRNFIPSLVTANDPHPNIWQVSDPDNPSIAFTLDADGLGLGTSFIAAGRYHALAVRDDGTVWGWGLANSGRLGPSWSTSASCEVARVGCSLPLQIEDDSATPLTGFTKVAAGSAHSIGLDNNDDIWTWGYNGSGQLGLGISVTEPPTKVPYFDALTVTDIAAGNDSDHSMAIVSGEIYRWGENGTYQLGNSWKIDLGTPISSPAPTPATVFSAISASRYFSLALRTNSSMAGWGKNQGSDSQGTRGVLGLGSESEVKTPSNLPAWGTISSMQGGSSHTIALNTDGTIYTSGDNGSGQLGPQTLASFTLSPVQLSTTGMSCRANPASFIFDTDTPPLDCDFDGDGVFYDVDACNGDDATNDTDLDGVCDDIDVCNGNDATGDTDGDGVCDDSDLCTGDDTFGDTDSDGLCNDIDPDDDNDGISDGSDPNDTDHTICGDTDSDSCDDCSQTALLINNPAIDYDTANDGTDTDSDGLCDAGDTDDDNDGILDASDPNDTDHTICGDTIDGDSCDDCSQTLLLLSNPAIDYNAANDGTDTDGDGLCDLGDPDDDNDGISDGSDPNDTDHTICGDTDSDSCDDCSQTALLLSNPAIDYDTANDGTDTDSDGLCDTGDTDDDNDGILDASDPNDTDHTICGDTDSDSCDDCSQTALLINNPAIDYDTANDGTDTDSDGLCDLGDPDDDNDGILDGSDPNDTDHTICGDTDSDSCDDCSQTALLINNPAIDYDTANDGTDSDSDGLCDAGDPEPSLPLGISAVGISAISNLSGGLPVVDFDFTFTADVDGAGADTVWLVLNGNPVQMLCSPASLPFSCSYTTRLGPASGHTYSYEVRDISNNPLLNTLDINGPTVELLNGPNMVGLARDVTTATGLQTLMGSSGVYNWQSGGLTNGINGENQGSFLIHDNSTPNTHIPGEGYFILRESNPTIPALTMAEPDTVVATISVDLQPGWNIISNPYGVPILLSALEVEKDADGPVTWATAAGNSWFDNVIYYYNGTDWGSTYSFESAGGGPDATLTPWLSYWVYLRVDDGSNYKLIFSKP